MLKCLQSNDCFFTAAHPEQARARRDAPLCGGLGCHLLYFPAKLRRQAIDAVAQKATAITEMEALSVASGLAGHDRVAVAAAAAVARKILMMTAVLLLANEIGRRTIAEGVESRPRSSGLAAALSCRGF